MSNNIRTREPSPDTSSSESMSEPDVFEEKKVVPPPSVGRRLLHVVQACLRFMVGSLFWFI